MAPARRVGRTEGGNCFLPRISPSMVIFVERVHGVLEEEWLFSDSVVDAPTRI